MLSGWPKFIFEVTFCHLLTKKDPKGENLQTATRDT